MFRAVEKVVGLMLPPNLVFLRRAIGIYVSLILLVTAASPIVLLVYVILNATNIFAIIGVLGLTIGAGIFIHPLVGFFGLFVLSVSLGRLLIGEMELLSSTRRVTVKAKNIITRNRALRLTVSLVLWSLPIALIPISVGVSLLALSVVDSEPTGVSELLIRYGRPILVWTSFFLFFGGFVVLAALIAVSAKKQRRSKPGDYKVVNLSTGRTLYLSTQTEETGPSDAPTTQPITSESLLQGAIIITTLTGVVGYVGVILMALSVQSALWSDVLLYGLIAVFAGVGLLALGALSARIWRQRTPPSASEVS